MRLIAIILQLIIIFPLLSQHNTSEKIDSILEASYNKFVELKFIESLELSEKALEISLDAKNEKGITYSQLYIARVLQEVGLKMDALKYIDKIEESKYYKKDAFLQSEIHRIRGRVASSQRLFTLEKEHYLKQLEIAESITDTKKKNLSMTMAYFYIQHLYVKQNNLDSVVVYQDLLKQHFNNNSDSTGSYYYITLFADKGLLYKNLNRYEEAAKQLDKSFKLAQEHNPTLLFYILQIYGDLELARKDSVKALSYYKEALSHSLDVNINHKTMYLHKRISDLLINNKLAVDEAKKHLREYNIINDSLNNHNKMLADLILSGIVKEKDEASLKRTRVIIYILAGIILLSILIALVLIFRNRIYNRMLMKKNRQLVSTTKEIELLEEELESNIYQDIVELAKNNSSEFLPLFEKGYPEFVEAMRNLNPSLRSSELHFCALAYLNFSTKDIADFTFVTIRAVQVRRNRIRKKYDIPSEVDFNEWFRSLPIEELVNEDGIRE